MQTVEVTKTPFDRVRARHIVIGLALVAIALLGLLLTGCANVSQATAERYMFTGETRGMLNVTATEARAYILATESEKAREAFAEQTRLRDERIAKAVAKGYGEEDFRAIAIDYWIGMETTRAQADAELAKWLHVPAKIENASARLEAINRAADAEVNLASQPQFKEVIANIPMYVSQIYDAMAIEEARKKAEKEKKDAEETTNDEPIDGAEQ